MQAREQAAEEASQRGEAAEKELLLARAASAEQARLSRTLTLTLTSTRTRTLTLTPLFPLSPMTLTTVTV